MLEAILQPQVQEFIFTYDREGSILAFAGSPFPEIPVQKLLVQIESRRAIEKKLPTWFSNKNIYYPSKLNLEQTSSETTAAYKAGIVDGNSVADITGGFGVDAYYFAKRFKTVAHFEQNKTLSAIAAHNFSVFGKDNITCHAEDGLLGISETRYDVLYVDPSRRNDQKGKVFFLEDCEPNVVDHFEYLMQRCTTLLIKTSPMLDISVGLGELGNVHEVHCIAVQNEVKELLWVLKEGSMVTPLIKTINVKNDGIQEHSFLWKSETTTSYSKPLRFLYEPNAAILKTGGYQYLSEAYKLKKLQKNSHLFTGEMLRDFPGRRFAIEKVVPYSKKAMQRGITFEKANIATRNFPESVANLRKKWKLKDGGTIYLFFTTLENEQKIMLICKKV